MQVRVSRATCANSVKDSVVRTFARDVTVNVLANLIAAAIIYLLGILVGLFPRTAEAVNLSIVVILVGSFTVLAIAAISRLRSHPQRAAYHKSLYVSAIAGIAFGVSVIAYHLLLSHLSMFDRITGTIGGIGFTLLMTAVIAALRHQTASREATAVGHKRGGPQDS
jgi:hypothetical protein